MRRLSNALKTSSVFSSVIEKNTDVVNSQRILLTGREPEYVQWNQQFIVVRCCGSSAPAEEDIDLELHNVSLSLLSHIMSVLLNNLIGWNTSVHNWNSGLHESSSSTISATNVRMWALLSRGSRSLRWEEPQVLVTKVNSRITKGKVEHYKN